MAVLIIMIVGLSLFITTVFLLFGIGIIRWKKYNKIIAGISKISDSAKTMDRAFEAIKLGRTTFSELSAKANNLHHD